MSHTYKDYGFESGAGSHMHAHFMPHVLVFSGDLNSDIRVLDVGCGNGSGCNEFIKRGCKVVGVDLSEQGINWARSTYPQARFEVIAADMEILNHLGEEPFDIVVSTEVVEHLYAPRDWARGCFAALKPGGTFICTTPYHGYWKNLLISLFGKWDTHADPLWDGGHIKLWSRRKLANLLMETGFTDVRFRGAGRVWGIWMTMVVKSKKPK